VFSATAMIWSFVTIEPFSTMSRRSLPAPVGAMALRSAVTFTLSVVSVFRSLSRSQPPIAAPMTTMSTTKAMIGPALRDFWGLEAVSMVYAPFRYSSNWELYKSA
jgi:hypothetical protein